MNRRRFCYHLKDFRPPMKGKTLIVGFLVLEPALGGGRSHVDTYIYIYVYTYLHLYTGMYIHIYTYGILAGRRMAVDRQFAYILSTCLYIHIILCL